VGVGGGGGGGRPGGWVLWEGGGWYWGGSGGGGGWASCGGEVGVGCSFPSTVEGGRKANPHQKDKGLVGHKNVPLYLYWEERGIVGS